MRPLILVLSILAVPVVCVGQDVLEKRYEQKLDNGKKDVHINRISELSGDFYRYKADGTLEKHISSESHPNGRLVCRRSYDAQGNLLAFQTFSYDRDWKARAVRTFNAAGKLVLYAVSGKSDNEPSTFYTDDTPNRKRIELASPEYFKIVGENHLEPFQ
jgi:hypothetical protein